MKISINNFKSIGSLDDYQVKPLTVLSGTNSSGKSSFIQLLLLIKETVDIDSSRIPLYTQGQLFKVREVKDIIKGKNENTSVSFGLSFKKSDFDRYRATIPLTIYDGLPDYDCRVRVVYGFKGGESFVSSFGLQYEAEDLFNQVIFEQKNITGENASITSDNEYVIQRFYDEQPEKINKFQFSGFFPSAVEFTRFLPSREKNEVSELTETVATNLTAVKQLIQKIFSELYYIGPLRVEPKDSYSGSGSYVWVGSKGENVASLLEKRAKDPVDLLIPIFSDDGVTFSEGRMSLIAAVNLWICEVFKLGRRIFATEKGDAYSVYLVNEAGVEVSIKHVGFGISQILPIIVQGLLMERGATMVLEQPEIHLHPKIQSLLFDYLYSLGLNGKTIIVETHSDHLITRMRRRIAEENDSQLNAIINLTFIEPQEHDVLFRTLGLDEYGVLDYFPAEFIDKPDVERRAIVSAQMKKRIKNSSNE